ncbi:unnamed protein product [Laminaria digitata]
MKATLSMCLVAAVLCSPRPCVGKRTAKDWGKMDLDDLEKQWEDGDDLEELKTEQQAKFERLEKRRKEAEASAGTFDPSMLNKMDAAEIGAMAAGQKDAAGPAMLFAQVGWGVEGSGPGGEDGELSKEETDGIGGRLQHLAQLGGLELEVYTIGDGSVLVSTQKGWEGKEILDFLLSRPEVSKVTWNSKDFLPPSDRDEL